MNCPQCHPYCPAGASHCPCDRPSGQFSCGTSRSRDDTGDGACETVFVTEFHVLRRANPAWRAAKPVALFGGAAFLFALLVA